MGVDRLLIESLRGLLRHEFPLVPEDASGIGVGRGLKGSQSLAIFHPLRPGVLANSPFWGEQCPLSDPTLVSLSIPSVPAYRRNPHDQ